jgi:hypothetical protein
MSKNTEVPTPASSSELLNAADRGSGVGQRLARDAAINDGAFAITLAVLIASFLLAVEYVFPSGNLVLIYGSVAIYGIGVVAVVLWNQRRRRASRPGWSKRYGAGFAITMAFYAIGVALSVSLEPSSLTFWVPYALVTAAPLVIAALWSDRK